MYFRKKVMVYMSLRSQMMRTPTQISVLMKMMNLKVMMKMKVKRKKEE